MERPIKKDCDFSQKFVVSYDSAKFINEMDKYADALEKENKELRESLDKKEEVKDFHKRNMFISLSEPITFSKLIYPPSAKSPHVEYTERKQRLKERLVDLTIQYTELDNENNLKAARIRGEIKIVQDVLNVLK